MPPPRTILLVDDSPLFLDLERSYFEGLPYAIETAQGGRQSLESMKAKRPDLVVLDEEMPDLKGHVVLEQLRRMESMRAVPVILVTGEKDDHVIERCMRLGLTDYIKRPFEPEELLRKVAKALGLPERKLVSFLVRLRRGAAGSPGGKGSEGSTFARAVDLSGTGIRVETREPLQVNEILALEFFVPGGKTRIQTQAQVMRRLQAQDARDRGYGLRFMGLPSPLRDLIEASVKAR